MLAHNIAALLGAFDMGSRILSRFKAADAAAESKKAE